MVDVPKDIETPRLTLRCSRPSDAPEVLAAITDSFEELHRWMRWADELPTLHEVEAHSRRLHIRFHQRDALPYRAYLKGTDTMVATCDLHHIDWNVPKFEIGYWVRTKFAGQGYMRECVKAVTKLAFSLGAKRVEIRSSSDNVRSCRVAEACGFELEGTLRHDNRWPNGDLKDMRVYSRIEPLPD